MVSHEFERHFRATQTYFMSRTVFIRKLWVARFCCAEGPIVLVVCNNFPIHCYMNSFGIRYKYFNVSSGTSKGMHWRDFLK